MKLLHTSDWHLGRSFGPFSLLGDQQAFCEWLVETVRSEKPDLVVVAGDIYDRAIASVESIELFRVTLRRIHDLKAKVAVISGNHDAADRLSPYDDLLDGAGVFIRGAYEGIGRVIPLTFDDGPLDLVLLPFLNPQGAPDHLENGDEGHGTDDGGDLLARRQSRTHESVLQAAVAIAQQDLQAPRSVAVAHAFVKGGQTSESERLLGVGGAGMVSGKLFSQFSYSALGHLHRPQEASGPTIRYSGSPVPYSFSEVHGKSVTMVEIDALGECQVRKIPIEVGRQVMTVEGMMDELLGRQPNGGDQEAFVRAIVTDPGTVLDAKARLSQRYPNVVEVNLRPRGDGDSGLGLSATSERHRTPLDATLEFWEEVEQSEPDEQTVELLTSAVGDALQEVAA